jgi:hypothetical protein
MDYTKITEAYGNLIKAIKEAGIDIVVSKIKTTEGGEREVFIKIKARRPKSYVLKD